MAENPPVVPIDLVALAERGEVSGPLWSHAGTDLNANFVRLGVGERIAAHVNDEFEVLLVALVGSGVVEVAGRHHTLAPGKVIIIPAGVRRAIESGGTPFGYLTCHRRRGGLWPRGLPRPGTDVS